MRTTLVLWSILAFSRLAAAQASMQVIPPHVSGPRPLEQQTANAVVKNYIDAWQTLHDALDQNRVDLLDRDFVGDAYEKIATTIKQQTKEGLRTSYKDVSHKVQIVFYSPEGLSVQLTDDVDYSLQLQDHDKVIGNQQVSAHYIVVLTPSETRWRVREFEAVTSH